ncbi:hypothetical protein AWB71_05242 [Caballeronia peredens]|nr:hypothetical protein AWB71_05242 [Caballeronia peredens]
MPLTPQDIEHLEAFKALEDFDTDLVETLLENVKDIMIAWGEKPAADERSQALLAALTRYLLESRTQSQDR